MPYINLAILQLKTPTLTVYSLQSWSKLWSTSR